jgi:tetratricopeptide (TPR) repeat protein
MKTAMRARRPLTPRQRRALYGWGTALVVMAVFVASANSYYQQQRDTWLSSATVPSLVKAAREHPNDAEILHTAGRRLFDVNRGAEAYPLAARAAAMEPRRAPYQVLVGHLLVQRGQPIEGLRAYETACRLEPRLAAAHSAAGQLYLAAGLSEDAVRHAQAAWNVHLPDLRVHVLLVEALLQAGRYDEAEKQCRGGLEYAPFTAYSGRAQLVRILLARGRTQEAEDAIIGHIKRFYYMVGSDFFAAAAAMLVERNRTPARLAEAEQMARRAVTKYPHDDSTRLAVGIVRWAEGRYAEAVPELRAALAEPKYVVVARRYLSRSLRAIGDVAAAREYEKAIPTPAQQSELKRLATAAGADPGNRDAALALARAEAAVKEHRAAFLACWPALQVHPDDPELLALADAELTAELKEPREE